MEQINPPQYTNSIVAFLDILGFKNTINTKAFDQIRDIFLTIAPLKEAEIPLKRAAGESDNVLLQYNESLEKAKVHVMSDSLVVSVPNEYPEALAVVIDICTIVQETLYSMDEPIFLRGAIAEGDFYNDENMTFGKALVEAYWAEEHYAKYPRIIVSDALLEGKCVSVASQEVLLRDEEDGYCYLNTLEKYLGIGFADAVLILEKYQKMKDYIDQELKGYKDPSIREKYIWLRKELARIAKKKGIEDVKLFRF